MDSGPRRRGGLSWASRASADRGRAQGGGPRRGDRDDAPAGADVGPGTTLDPPGAPGRGGRHHAVDRRGADASRGGHQGVNAAREARAARGREWWRWGRVELPVQDLLPEPTTSVSDALSSIPRAGIGTVPRDPVALPCGLDPELRDAPSGRIPA